MPWNLVLEDTFDRANTAYPTSGTSSSTSVGNGWTDRNGQWHIDTNRAQCRGTTYGTDYLYRPTGEDHTSQRFVGRYTHGAGNHLLAAKFTLVGQNGTVPDSLLIGHNGNVGINVWTQVNNTINELISSPAVTGTNSQVSGRIYRREVDITDDGTTITIVVRLYDETTNGTGTTTVQCQGTYTTTLAALLGKRGYALDAANGGTAWDYVALYTEEATGGATMAVSPTTVTESSTGNVLQLTGTGTAWAEATVFSVNAGSITAKTWISPTRVDLTYTAPAGGQTVTISNNLDAATASLTIATASGLTAGTLSKGTVTGASSGVNGTVPTGGTTPYTYAWHRSKTSGFTPGAGTLLAGQASQNLADTTIAHPAVYYYRRVVTDAAGAAATSGEVAIATVRSALILGTGPADSLLTAYLGAGTHAGEYAETYLEQGWGERAVTFVHRGISGSTTADWLPDNANNNLTNAKAAYAAAGVTAVIVMLGTNDSKGSVARTPAAYLTNMTAIVNNLVAAGYAVILCYPPYIVPGTASNTWAAADVERLRQYHDQLDTLINNTTIFKGDQDVWPYAFNNAATLYGDGVHFSAGGAQIYGRMLARAVMATIGGHGRGGTTGTILTPDAIPQIAEDSGAQTITLRRTAQQDITSGSVGIWNGAERMSRRIGPGSLEVDLLATDVDDPGSATLLIFKPS